MEEKEKRISYRAPLSRWKALTDLATNRESSIQELIDNALDRAYFSGELHPHEAHAYVSLTASPPGAYDPAHEKYHQMLAEVLNSGVREYILALIMNVRAWSKATRDRLGYPTDEADAIPDPTGLVAELDRLTRASRAIREGKIPEAKRKRA
jgi:hypothetical protein